jgi:alanine racemase
VGIVSEGIELREQGIQAPIQVLVGIFPDEADDLIQHNLTTTLHSRSLAETLARRAGLLGKEVGVHIKVDTGMGRLGVSPDELPGLAEFITGLKNIRIESIFTHFSSADDEDPGFTQNQIERFQSALEQLKVAKFNIPLVHCANSAALLQFPESQFDLVRPGIALYGALPAPALATVVESLSLENKSFSLRPVMQWKTRILTLNSLPKGSPVSYGQKFITQRNSCIATLPVGYADGLERLLTNRMNVMVLGHKAPQVGTICMDMCMIDVTDITEAQEGDEVVLFGQQGKEILIQSINTLGGAPSGNPVDDFDGDGRIKKVSRAHLNRRRTGHQKFQRVFGRPDTPHPDHGNAHPPGHLIHHVQSNRFDRRTG